MAEPSQCQRCKSLNCPILGHCSSTIIPRGVPIITQDVSNDFKVSNYTQAKPMRLLLIDRLKWDRLHRILERVQAQTDRLS